MGLFGLINYENHLLHGLVTSSYAKNGLMIILTYVITGLVRFHLSAILCVIFSGGNWFDNISPIIITVLLSLASDNIYRYVKTHKKSYERLVEYIITNYSMDNFILWKRYVLVVLAIYIMLALYLVEISNRFILITVIQTAISFGICDLLENNIPQVYIWRILRKWKREPTMEEFAMVDGFYFPPRALQIANLKEIDGEVVAVISSKTSLVRTSSYSKVISIIPEDIPAKPLTPPTIRKSTEKLLTPPTMRKSMEVMVDKPLIHNSDDIIAEKSLTPPMIRRR